MLLKDFQEITNPSEPVSIIGPMKWDGIIYEGPVGNIPLEFLNRYIIFVMGIDYNEDGTALFLLEVDFNKYEFISKEEVERFRKEEILF